MSRSALIFFGLALVLLGLGAVVTLTPDGAPPPSGPLLGVQPSEITVIRVRRPGASQAEIVSRDAGDQWRFRREDDGIPAGQGWPVLTDRARGVARVLSSMRATGRAARPLPADSLRIELGLTDGTWKTLVFDDASVGGQRAVEIDGERWLVDAAVVDLFLNPGPSIWRDASALPGLNMDVSKITIKSPGQELTLARTGAAWRLASPFNARADDVAVRRLVTSLGAIRIDRFIDEPLADASAQDAARVTVICETNLRRIGADDEIEESTRTTTLGLQGAADVAAQTFFATDGHGRRFVVSGSALTDMSLSPESYVALTPTSYTPADIGMMQIEEPSGATRAYRRGLGAWTQQMPDGAARPVDARAIDASLQLLCATPAASVARTPPEGLASLGVVTLLDFDNGPLVELALGSTPQRSLVIGVTPAGFSSPVYYLVYDSAPPDLLLPGGVAPPASS